MIGLSTDTVKVLKDDLTTGLSRPFVPFTTTANQISTASSLKSSSLILKVYWDPPVISSMENQCAFEPLKEREVVSVPYQNPTESAVFSLIADTLPNLI